MGQIWEILRQLWKNPAPNGRRQQCMLKSVNYFLRDRHFSFLTFNYALIFAALRTLREAKVFRLIRA